MTLKTHNMPEYMIAFQEIDDLYEECKNFADGEPIQSEEMHDAITKLRAAIHEAGKKAEALRVEEKKPLDDQIDAIQSRYNPYVQAKKGKVDKAKSALDDLLVAWRKKIADEKARIAAQIAEEARLARLAAEEAIRASSGNLEARDEAEELLKDVKKLDKAANKADKAASSGLGLRTVWRVEIEDIDAALTWCYEKDEAMFQDLALSIAQRSVNAGLRNIPGFKVIEEKVAR